jgi:transposase-like protein
VCRFCSRGIRRIIYTTNIIEGFRRQLRAITKAKGAFQSEEALLKLLFLAQDHITAKWTKPVFNWNQTLSQLSIIFPDRLN